MVSAAPDIEVESFVRSELEWMAHMMRVNLDGKKYMLVGLNEPTLVIAIDARGARLGSKILEKGTVALDALMERYNLKLLWQMYL